MNADLAEPLLGQAYLIRAVEQRLLELFAQGKLNGTTHTCIGQELSAVCLARQLRTDDVVFSNHRCHGHYLALSDDVEGLIAEIMGKRSGVCGGLGGSQHLCGRNFYSNGVQGGIVPVSAGIALAQKRRGKNAIAVVCIGDGTLGEGALYEALNIASKWELPLLIVLENNLYAQSTAQHETLAGGIAARFAAFGIDTYHGSVWDYAALDGVMARAVDQVRESARPAFVQVDCYRLAAHSKGDDNRDSAEVKAYWERDPLNRFIQTASAERQAQFECIHERVEQAVRKAEQDSVAPFALAQPEPAVDYRAVTPESGTQLQAINRALRNLLQSNPNAILLGEDIRSPYGGAFKATQGLSADYPDRVFNTPISEAAIVGVGNGLALSGLRPIVEIMFGDFLGLCFDQLLNHAAKFVGMYNRKVSLPLIVRTPMGGGRGYGPTHSQNLEKHCAGIPGLDVLVFHGRTQVGACYRALARIDHPVLVIENKLLYAKPCDAEPPAGFAWQETDDAFPTTVLRPVAPPDLTLVAFGRMSLSAEEVAAALYRDEEIAVEIVLPLRVSPLVLQPILESVRRTRKLLVVEEGAQGFDLGSEVIAALAAAWDDNAAFRARRLAAAPMPIPSAGALEAQALPSAQALRAACLELFDA